MGGNRRNMTIRELLSSLSDDSPVRIINEHDQIEEIGLRSDVEIILANSVLDKEPAHIKKYTLDAITIWI